jgi:hypothetical protein
MVEGREEKAKDGSNMLQEGQKGEEKGDELLEHPRCVYANQ